MRKLRRVVLSVLLGVSATSAASAQPKGKDRAARAAEAPADVETAEQLYAKLDYDKANEVAERVTKQRNLSHDQLVRAYRILAVTDAILDKEDQAREAFLQLLVFDPEYTVDTNLGPKVSAPFIEARGQFRSLPSKPGMEVVANVRADGGQLRVTTRDPTRIAKKVSVGYRWTSSGEYTVTTVGVGEASVEVAPATAGRTRLDFYALALDERDNAVFEAGNPQVPKSAFAEAGARPGGGGAAGGGNEKSGGSVFSSPVFWIIAGAVVAGGGTAAFFAFRPEDPATRASLSPQIRCGAELCK
ncbi:MAG: hypothetical protein KIS78_29285 [Labilithrix sp.]|nr:hypothetical protein [Labilithrix sp.]MCW5836529.1 hypothetical protein [Labilithrix sp.]